MHGAHPRHGTDGTLGRRTCRTEDLQNEYLSGLVDRIRTPLGDVLGYTEALLSGDLGPLDGRRADLLRLVDRHSQLLLRMLEHVDVPDAPDRLGPGEPDRADGSHRAWDVEDPIDRDLQPTDIAPVVRSAVARVSLDADRAGVALIGRIPEGVVAVADRALLERALVRVLSNAIRFSHPGGRVGIDLRPADGAASIMVVDEGWGIQARDLERIFDRGFRSDLARSADPDGAGIGLAVTRSIMDRHGGSIHVESAPGAGTGVTLSVPLVEATPTTSHQGPRGRRYGSFIRTAVRRDDDGHLTTDD